MHYKLLFTEQWAELPVLQQVSTSCLFYTWNCIYVNPSLPICPNLPSSRCARQCPHIHSLHLRFYSCPGNRFICIIFLNSTYVLMMVFWKKMMKVMGIMVMIVIGGDEGMMVVVAMMFLMWLYLNSWHWKRSSSLNYVWPPYFLHISPFSWLPLAHPCLFVCMNNVFPPIFFSPSSLSFPSLMCHTFSPKRLPLLPNWSLCFTVWLLLPSTTLNPFSTWQSEWSWESINHILLLPVYLHLGKNTWKTNFLSISYKTLHDVTQLCSLALCYSALWPPSSSHTLISSDLWTIQVFINLCAC